MSNYINIDVGSVDLYFKDIASLVAADSAEDDLLAALAGELARMAGDSKDAAEKAFCLEAELEKSVRAMRTAAALAVAEHFAAVKRASEALSEITAAWGLE